MFLEHVKMIPEVVARQQLICIVDVSFRAANGCNRRLLVRNVEATVDMVGQNAFWNGQDTMVFGSNVYPFATASSSSLGGHPGWQEWTTHPGTTVQGRESLRCYYEDSS